MLYTSTEVEHFWYRTEAQNRGALHFHGVLWLKEGTFVEDSIVSELPRGEDPESVHGKGKATDQCKYGFPFPLRDKDGYANCGSRYEYKRTLPEDQRIVPYNPYLLSAWDGHLNVQRKTTTDP